MPDPSRYNIFGWTLAICLYTTILSAGVYQLYEHNQEVKKYTAQKKNLLHVTLVERKTPKQLPKKKKIVKEKKSVDKPKPKSQPKTVRAKETKKAPPKPDLKNLFAKADIPDTSPKREQKTRKKIEKKEIAEVVKKDDAKKITKALNFEQQEQLIISQNDGIYDEFKGKISDILDSHWQETIDTVAGNTAIVLIAIDKFGNFSYTIETLSYNDDFNAKLRDFLMRMQDMDFPPYIEGEKFLMRTEFKDDYGE